jgi:hypothetical protein
MEQLELSKPACKGICGIQCKIAAPLLARGVSLESIEERMTEATDGRAANCRTDGPTGPFDRCGLDPGDRHVLQALVSVTLEPLAMLEMTEL